MQNKSGNYQKFEPSSSGDLKIRQVQNVKVQNVRHYGRPVVRDLLQFNRIGCESMNRSVKI
jgi:hypothetical protein